MIVDLIIILFAVAALTSGSRGGFVRRFWATAGFFGGLFAGRWLEPYVLQFVDGAEDRAIVTIAVLLASAMLGLSLGEMLGVFFKRRLLVKKVNHFDNALGSALSMLAVLAGFWLLASIVGNLPYQNLNRAFQASRIVRALNQTLPPAPHVIANIGQLIDPNGFPDVFIHNERIPSGKVNLPQLGEMLPAVNATKNSIVRITGQGCGGLVYGSGFVVDEGLVATNAHVIAGIERPFVQDINGTRRATVVWFNPDMDFALLRTTDLGGAPLKFVDRLPGPGEPGAVAGYPGGGRFAAAPAVILDSFMARGRDIYGQGMVVRDVYELQADVSQGNSGGPLISRQGRVIGMIFAESTSHDQVGYALTSSQLKSELARAGQSNRPVASGHCVR